ncbi:hypothetical protein FlaCF_3592 [Flavobacterium tructae]
MGSCCESLVWCKKNTLLEVRKITYIYKVLTLKPNNYEIYLKSNKC